VNIQSRVTGTIWISSTYGNWKSHTVEVNFTPKATSASVAMCQTSATPSTAGVGIKSFEYRDTPAGPNKKKHFDFYNLQTSVYHELMTTVTFAIGVVNGACWGGWTIDFWS
jgi:hypothetical protein